MALKVNDKIYRVTHFRYLWPQNKTVRFAVVEEQTGQEVLTLAVPADTVNYSIAGCYDLLKTFPMFAGAVDV